MARTDKSAAIAELKELFGFFGRSRNRVPWTDCCTDEDSSSCDGSGSDLRGC